LDVNLDQNDTEILFRTLNDKTKLTRESQAENVDALVVDTFAGIEGP
jgi:hypothetical protein